MTISTTTIPAGWYNDPAGSSAMRWWDGAQWTNNLQQPTPPPPPVFTPVVPQPNVLPPVQQQPSVLPPVQQQPNVLPPVAPPAVAQEAELSLSRYSPMTGYAQQPRDTAWGNDPYANRMPMASVSHNNTIAWVSFSAGIVSLGTILIVAMFPGNYFFPFFGLTAILSGIRAIVRYRSRRVTVLWAPIIGIVFGAIAELLLIGSYVLASTSAASTFVPVDVGPTGVTTNYDMGVGTPQYVPANNTTLTQAAMDETKIVATLQADYANGQTGPAVAASWPTALLHSASGDVTTSDGRDLGTLISPGWHLAYKVEGNDGYLLEVTGTNTKEVAVYSSTTDEYLAWCDSSDKTCSTNSPVPPLTSNGSGTSNAATPTTT